MTTEPAPDEASSVHEPAEPADTAEPDGTAGTGETGGTGATGPDRRDTRIGRWFPRDPTAVGDDPDYRFTLANERTFLAWVRTALALAAGGLAAVTILDDFTGEEVLGISLLALSFATAATAYRRWALNERAMRLNQPLPSSRLPFVMAIAVAVVALLAAILFAIDAS